MARYRHRRLGGEYNHQRPHQALDRPTPAERFTKANESLPEDLSEPTGTPPEGQPVIERRVAEGGIISVAGETFLVGAAPRLPDRHHRRQPPPEALCHVVPHREDDLACPALGVPPIDQAIAPDPGGERRCRVKRKISVVVATRQH